MIDSHVGLELGNLLLKLVHLCASGIAGSLRSVCGIACRLVLGSFVVPILYGLIVDSLLVCLGLLGLIVRGLSGVVLVRQVAEFAAGFVVCGLRGRNGSVGGVDLLLRGAGSSLGGLQIRLCGGVGSRRGIKLRLRGLELTGSSVLGGLKRF